MEYEIVDISYLDPELREMYLGERPSVVPHTAPPDRRRRGRTRPNLMISAKALTFLSDARRWRTAAEIATGIGHHSTRHIRTALEYLVETGVAERGIRPPEVFGNRGIDVYRYVSD